MGVVSHPHCLYFLFSQFWRGQGLVSADATWLSWWCLQNLLPAPSTVSGIFGSLLSFHLLQMALWIRASICTAHRETVTQHICGGCRGGLWIDFSKGSLFGPTWPLFLSASHTGVRRPECPSTLLSSCYAASDSYSSVPWPLFCHFPALGISQSC